MARTPAMPRVRFTANFDYRPKGNVIIAYREGHEGAVKQECADQAVAAGKALNLGGGVDASTAAPGAPAKPGEPQG